MIIIAEYVWIGAGGSNDGQTLRSKTRVFSISKNVISLDDFSPWNYDGSSTSQASGTDSEVILQPRAYFSNPLRVTKIRNRPQNHFLVLCDTYDNKGNPIFNNYRAQAVTIFNQKLEEEPWFGLEQEYFLLNPDTGLPLGFPDDVPNSGKPNTQGQYYCSAGAENAFGRIIAEEHLEACIHAGIKISGINAEVAPGQWEFQIGPCVGIEEGDHLWMARYLLLRIAENHGVSVSFEPKPIKGDWNGSGCHANYSTKNMRHGTIEINGKTGLDYINEAIEKLSKTHMEHMDIYGSGNEERMTGEHETASFNTFSDGVCNRGASIRRGTDTVNNKKGYFEDRRPSSNCDPYLVTSKLFHTTVLRTFE